MKQVRCPCLGCGFYVHIDYDPKEVRMNEKQALDKLIKHIKEQHTLGDIFEWLERATASYFLEELKRQASKP
jgi:hypothetical protein